MKLKLTFLAAFVSQLSGSPCSEEANYIQIMGGVNALFDLI